jgi:hypothetical protein
LDFLTATLEARRQKNNDRKVISTLGVQRMFFCYREDDKEKKGMCYRKQESNTGRTPAVLGNTDGSPMTGKETQKAALTHCQSEYVESRFLQLRV